MCKIICSVVNPALDGWNSEMKVYYEKRIAEGKSKMGTINTIRNKLLSRIFATVNRGTPYVNTLNYCS